VAKLQRLKESMVGCNPFSVHFLLSALLLLLLLIDVVVVVIVVVVYVIVVVIVVVVVVVVVVHGHCCHILAFYDTVLSSDRQCCDLCIAP
jgi:hypothetical protein